MPTPPQKGGKAPDPLQSDLGRPEPDNVTTGGQGEGLGKPGGPVTEGSPQGTKGTM